jgi:hypothetical protein
LSQLPGRLDYVNANVNILSGAGDSHKLMISDQDSTVGKNSGGVSAMCNLHWWLSFALVSSAGKASVPVGK